MMNYIPQSRLEWVIVGGSLVFGVLSIAGFIIGL